MVGLNFDIMLKRALSYSILFLLLAACSSPELEKFYTFPDNTWKRFENPVINMEISQPGIFYDLFVEVRYDNTLTLKPIPISIITSTPDGEVRSRTMSLKFNENNGTIKLILGKDFAFSEAGNCSFEFENRSQDIETHGLIKIVVVIDKIN